MHIKVKETVHHLEVYVYWVIKSNLLNDLLHCAQRPNEAGLFFFFRTT